MFLPVHMALGVNYGKIINYASINVNPKRGGGGRGGTLGICGAFDFSEEFVVKIPTVGPQNLVKSDQISPPVLFYWRS